MDVLVLGGSVFLGRAVVHEALAAGHAVTVFNRGVSGPPIPGADHVTGDRTVAADRDQLAGRRFDLVVDTSGYVPADVRDTAELFATSAHYAFVSTINVHPAWPERRDYRAAGLHRAGPDATREDAAHLSERDSYGWLKSGCERAVQRAFGDRCSILRCGLIVGPDDAEVGRLPWWLDRVARGGEVLVPGDPDDEIVLIDSRDVAQYGLARVPGAVEVTGPPHRDTRGGLVAACVTATGSDATVTFVDSDWLTEQDVTPWAELPLWIPPAQAPGVFASDPPAAVPARPLADTVADTWQWQRSLDRWQPTAMAPGLAAEKEHALLAAWHAR